jgi:hypothetical protein
MVTGNLNVTLRGDAQSMSEVEPEDLTVSVDLGDISSTAAGTITVPATILVNGIDGVGAIGSYSVVVRID